MDPRFGEYEVKKLRSPACSRQENAIFPLHIHGTLGPPFSASLYRVIYLLADLFWVDLDLEKSQDDGLPL